MPERHREIPVHAERAAQGLCFYSRTHKRVSDKIFIQNRDAPNSYPDSATPDILYLLILTYFKLLATLTFNIRDIFTSNELKKTN